MSRNPHTYLTNFSMVYWGGEIIELQKFSLIQYRIMQIIRGGKLSRFSRISLQSRRFSSEFFSFYCKVFQIAVQSRKLSRE